MKENLFNIFIKKKHFHYLFLILLAFIFPLIYYPRIYGSDDFQVLWMANAFKEGILFSENTWLVSPLSYFGIYPFSHRAIGVPIFFAFLLTFLSFISFNTLGIPEAILLYNFILILIIYKESHKLANRLFKEEWNRFVFVAFILLSPNIIGDLHMTVSTRIIITIIMIALLNLNIKLITQGSKIQLKPFLLILLICVIGSLVHRLWLGTIISVVAMVFTFLVQNYIKIQRFSMFLILPISILAFFIGLEIFGIDPLKIWSPFIDNSTLIGKIINILIDYMLKSGLITIFFPIGVVMTLKKQIIIYKKYNINIKLKLYSKNLSNYRVDFYMLLFMLPFSFLAPSFYSVVFFLPTLIYFSLKGLLFVKKYIQKNCNKLIWIYHFIMLLLSIGYSFLYVEIYYKINLWYIALLLSISLSLYMTVFIIYKHSSKISFDINKIQKFSFGFILVVSTLIFTTTTIVGTNTKEDSNLYPWDNRYLTDEEIKIIDYLHKENINGLIFCAVGQFVSERIAGVGFLPSFFDRTEDGKALFYGFTTIEEIHIYYKFSFTELYKLNFFVRTTYWFPIRIFRNSITNLNLSITEDIETLISLRVQYIITDLNCSISFSGDGKFWTLIQSLPSNYCPVLSTKNLALWKIY